MTIQTYMVIRGNKQTLENDPLIVKWIDKLNIQSENIVFVYDQIDGMVETKLKYNTVKDLWIVSTNHSMGDVYTFLHKLGYIWLWKKTKVLSKIKENWLKKNRTICLAESCIIDNIVHYNFCQMDIGFKEYWLGERIERIERKYRGAIWHSPLDIMVMEYILFYINDNYILPEEIRNKYASNIMHRFLLIRDYIIEKAELEGINYTMKDFRRLHRLLRLFGQIIKVKGYLAIQTYINQIFFYFPMK